jgi:hypothetical protein
MPTHQNPCLKQSHHTEGLHARMPVSSGHALGSGLKKQQARLLGKNDANHAGMEKTGWRGFCFQNLFFVIEKRHRINLKKFLHCHDKT